MKISCGQFEELITYYIDGELTEPLASSFEEHMHECPTCAVKFRVIKAIVKDIKNAYDKILQDNNYQDEQEIYEHKYETIEELSNLDLSAYIDNELSDENSVRVRKNIVARPNIRKKLEKMYKLRTILSNSYTEQKNSLRNDYSKDIVRSLNSEFTQREICIHCAIFILVVIFAIVMSIITVLKIV